MKDGTKRVLLAALIVISLLLVSPVVVPAMADNTTDAKAICGTPTDDAGEYQEDGVSVCGLDYGCTCSSRYCTIDECIVCTAWFRSEYPQDYTIDIWLYSGDSVEEHDRYEGTIGRFGYAEFPMCYCPSEGGWCPGWWKFCFKVEGKTHDSMPAKHCCVFEVVPPNKPDLKITDVWSDDSTIYYRIKNTGGKSAGASSTSLTVDGAPITSDYVASLSSRATRTGSFDYIWNCTGTSSMVRVCADCVGDVEEYNENNNCRSRTWICMPDLTITDIWCDNSTIYYTIKNVGNKKSGVSNTSLTVDDVLETLDYVTSLEPGEERTENFNYTWNCTDTNDTINVCADYTNDVEESNEENNYSKKTWSCADIWVNPTSFDVILPPGAVSNYTLIIGNSGTGPLEFTIDMDKKVADRASSSDMASTEVIGSPYVVRCECETTSGNSEDSSDTSIVIDDEYIAKSQKSLLIHPESTGVENIRQSENVNPISAKSPAVEMAGSVEPPDVEKIWLDRKVRITDNADCRAGEDATVGYKNVNTSPEENNHTSDEHDQTLNKRENQGRNASTDVGASALLYANDTAGNAGVSEPRKVIADMAALHDTTPPPCITNLSHICGQTWINWTWRNSDDEDFEYMIVNINGIWQADTSDSYYNATGLVPNASYEIEIRTVDRKGDMNETWVNDTASTLPLAFSVSIISPPDGQVFKVFRHNEMIDFHCLVSGGTPTYSLNWSSSVDGLISDEESFAKSLSAGVHVISLSATDSSGLDKTASANISVVIGMEEKKLRSTATTLIVPDSYPTIQQAVDNATDGDVIFVRGGTYRENININNKDLTIQGEDRETTIIDGGGSGDCIRVSSADINISGFTIKNAGNYGVYAYSSDLNINNATITDCGKDAIYFRSGKSLTLRDSVLENCGGGLVYCSYADADGNATIQRNIIRNNTGSGLYIYLDGKGDEAVINDNIITNNTEYGIKCDCHSYYIDSITMRNNMVRNCVYDGVYIEGAIDVNITDLIIENPGDNGLYAECYGNMTMKNSTVRNSGDDGIYLRGAFTPVLANNTITGSSGYGIYLYISSSTKNPGKLRNNALTKNKYGFSITGNSIASYYQDIDTSNTINGKPMYYLVGEENKILNGIPVGYLGFISCKNIEAKNLELTNNGQGVLMVNTSDSETDGNEFYLNNFINNADDVYSYRSTNNIWNSAEKITYTYNEKTYTNYMGNYWDDYTDVDADDDGIWDNPCPVDSDYDYYPLVGHVSDLADWLSVSPRSDTVYPGNQTDITVTLNTTGLDFGEYYVNVSITSNDPDEKTIVILLRLTITSSQKGDLNNDDNQITPADAAIALHLAATGAQNPAADVSGDGQVTSLDALMILQAAAGAI